MQRRSFLQSLVAVLADAPWCSTRAAPPRRILIQESPLEGFQYHQGGQVWPLLTTGAPLQLVREPENPYDQNAVRAEWRDRKIGYVPRYENTPWPRCWIVASGSWRISCA